MYVYYFIVLYRLRLILLKYSFEDCFITKSQDQYPKQSLTTK